jgi:hypothetical protein
MNTISELLLFHFLAPAEIAGAWFSCVREHAQSWGKWLVREWQDLNAEAREMQAQHEARLRSGPRDGAQ